MATWQESNGGSFLAGIGSQNNNAPRSIDSLPTLGLIQQNNEFTRQGGNNVGLQGLQGLYGLSNMHQQEQQQRQQQAFQSEYGAALKSGDREQIRALLSKYPQQVQAIQDGMKWSDDDYRATLGDLATRGQIAAQSPKTFYSWIGNNAEALQKAGADPSQLAAMYQQDPAGTAQLIGSVGMHALGHEKYWDLQDKIAGREIDRGKLAEDIRSNQASEANTRRGQSLSYQSATTGHNLAAQRLALDQQKFELDVQQAYEKSQALINGAPPLSVNMEKSIEKSVNDATASTNSASSMRGLAQQFRDEKPTTGLFGNANNMFAKLTGSDTTLRDLRIRQNALVNSQVLKFLPPGPATDRDVEIVRQGAPTDMDNPAVVARWLDAMANLEEQAAKFNSFKAEWMSANGNPGQSRNGGQILGMDVNKGESMGSAVKRYLASETAEPASSGADRAVENKQPSAPSQSGYTSKSGIQFTVE